MSPTQIKNLTISSVDSVDKGAGKGVKVLLLKRDGDESTNVSMVDIARALGRLVLTQKRNAERRSNPMSNATNITVTDVIKAMKAVMPGPSIAAKVDAVIKMIEDGRIDGFVAAQLEQRLADERYPGDRCALAKFQNDPDGMRLLNAAVKTSYVELQKRTALGDGYDAVMKMNKPHAHAASPRDTSDDDGDESTDQKVERLMRDKNISRDAAISILHRAEKVAKGFAF
jgi:hypothetical protein